MIDFDTIAKAQEILNDAPVQYPVYLWVDGVHYRIDSEDAEPVEIETNPEERA